MASSTAPICTCLGLDREDGHRGRKGSWYIWQQQLRSVWEEEEESTLEISRLVCLDEHEWVAKEEKLNYKFYVLSVQQKKKTIHPGYPSFRLIATGVNGTPQLH